MATSRLALLRRAVLGVPVAEEPEVRFSINGSGEGLLAGDRCMSLCTPETVSAQVGGSTPAPRIKGWFDAPAYELGCSHRAGCQGPYLTRLSE